MKQSDEWLNYKIVSLRLKAKLGIPRDTKGQIWRLLTMGLRPLLYKGLLPI